MKKSLNAQTVNNVMSENNIPDLVVKKPDEQSSMNVEALIKIFDPESNEVFVEKRA